MSRNSEAVVGPTGHGNGGSGGTVRSLRNGIHPRKLLSGFIRKTQRTTTPDAPSMAGPPLPIIIKEGARDRDRDRDLEGDQENGKENKGGSEKTKARERDKGPAGLPPDTRQPETVARAQ
jgi:hypothetical protein